MIDKSILFDVTAPLSSISRSKPLSSFFLTFFPVTVNLDVSNTCNEPSFNAASTSATLSAVPSAQESPNLVIATASTSYPSAQF